MLNGRLVVVAFTLTISFAFVNAQTPQTPAAGAGQTATTGEQRVSLGEQATAHDSAGLPALAGRLRTQDLRGSQDSPVTNIRVVISNTSRNLFTYVSGWATFYDTEGVRCGEGLFKVSALAPGESAETDTPGLRVTCAPSTWRIVATNLLTPSTLDTAKPGEAGAATSTANTGAATTPAAVSTTTEQLMLSIDGEDHPIQVGNPIVIRGRNRSMTLILKRAR